MFAHHTKGVQGPIDIGDIKIGKVSGNLTINIGNTHSTVGKISKAARTGTGTSKNVKATIEAKNLGKASKLRKTSTSKPVNAEIENSRVSKEVTDLGKTLGKGASRIGNFLK